MGKSEGTTQQIQAQKLWATTTNSFQQKRTLWLAAMLAFFVPSMAASAWYASSNQTSPQSNDSINTSADVEGAQASTTTELVNPSASSVGSSDSTPQGPNFKTEVSVNGKKVQIPASGNINKTEISEDGTETNLNISVSSEQSSPSRTRINSRTSTQINSNNNNTSSTSINNTYTSSP